MSEGCLEALFYCGCGAVEDLFHNILVIVWPDSEFKIHLYFTKQSVLNYLSCNLWVSLFIFGGGEVGIRLLFKSEALCSFKNHIPQV